MARSCDITLDVSRSEWLDTGITLSENDSLHLAVTFVNPVVLAGGVTAYPEGAYLSPTAGYAPGKVVTVVTATAATGTPIASNAPPFAIIAVLTPDGATPGTLPGAVTSALRTDRYTFNPWEQLCLVAGVTSVSGWRVWGLNNSPAGTQNANVGEVRLIFSLRAGATQTLGYGQADAPTNTWAQTGF